MIGGQPGALLDRASAAPVGPLPRVLPGRAVCPVPRLVQEPPRFAGSRWALLVCVGGRSGHDCKD